MYASHPFNIELESVELFRFAQLIEKHQDILLDTNIPLLKIKKLEAAIAIISEWATNTGEVLTETQLFKKIHNMKARLMLASREGNDLLPWQKKIAELLVCLH